MHESKMRSKEGTWIIFFILLISIILVMNYFHHHRYTVNENPPPVLLRNRCFSTHRKKVVSFSNQQLINPYFTYRINVEHACMNRHVEIVMPVHSAITNFVRRNRTRRYGQGHFAKNHYNKALMIFFVGLPSEKLNNSWEFQQQLEHESQTHGDIVQINLNETYRNIVYKAIAVLQWVNTYCNKTEFVLKMDDDIFVDPSLLLMGLYKYRNLYSEFIVGELRTNRKPERSREIKWHMPEKEYPNATFPPFVPGPVLGYPTSTAWLLYQQALRTKTIWLDDIFITGICSQILGIPILHDRNFATEYVHIRPTRLENFIYQ